MPEKDARGLRGWGAVNGRQDRDADRASRSRTSDPARVANANRLPHGKINGDTGLEGRTASPLAAPDPRGFLARIIPTQIPRECRSTC